MLPLFVTVDTEGDDLWTRPEAVTTENAGGIERFQKFCEERGVIPIYLTAYEMTQNLVFVKTIRPHVNRGLCEIGMHMHPWNCPPLYNLTGADLEHLPFAIDYPRDVIEEKVRRLTYVLENTFDDKVISHRAGRWGTDLEYLSILRKNGYLVDCSYTPLVNWGRSFAAAPKDNIVDYSDASKKPSVIELESGKMLEIPMTVMHNKLYYNTAVRTALKLVPEKMSQKKFFRALSSRQIMMLRPDVRRKRQQLHLIEQLKQNRNLEHVEFMIHSSEVYKGTSPHCRTEGDVDKMYEIMDAMFKELETFCRSISFKSYLDSRNKLTMGLLTEE